MQGVECSLSFTAHSPSELGLPWWLTGKGSARQYRRRRLSPWVRKFPWRRKWQPTQCSCLENSIDKGAWWATVHGVMKESDTTEWVHRHTPSEPSWPTLTVGSHRTGSSAGKCRLLIKHQEARFQTPWCSEIFQSCLRDKSYPEMCFWKRGTFRMAQNKMPMKWRGIGSEGAVDAFAGNI